MNAELRMIGDQPLPGPDFRRAVTERMAKTLIERDGLGGHPRFTDERSMRVLLEAGFVPFLVTALYRDARQIAMQEIVAREMEKP